MKETSLVRLLRIWKKATGLANSPDASAAQSFPEVSNFSLSQSSNKTFNKSALDNTLPHLCTLMSNHMKQQNQQMQLQMKFQEQVFQQQEMLSQMVAMLNCSASQGQNQFGPSSASLNSQDQCATNYMQVPEHFSVASSNATKFLSSQIP